MKRQFRIIISLFVAVLAMSSCKKTIEQLTTFDFSRTAEFEIPGALALDSAVSISTPSVATNFSKTLEDNGLSSDKIESFKNTGVNLKITAPEGQNFNFLKSIKIFIKSDGIDEVLIASKVDISNDGLNSLDLNASNNNLLPFIKSDKFSLRIEVITDELITQKVYLTAIMNFQVKAKIFK